MYAMKTNRTAWASGLLVIALVSGAALTQGCTDLDEETFGVIEQDNFFNTEEEILAGLAPVYAQLRQVLEGYHNLSQVSSDETVVPTRGSDWFDNGNWLALQRQNWDPSLGPLNDAWNQLNTGIARANVLLQSLEAEPVGQEALIAELRGVRAFYYYLLMDLFGSVPLVGDEPDEYIADPDNPPPGATRQEVFDFIRSELTAAREQLPAERDAGSYGRMTQGAVDAILANMYLNAAVFTQSADGISPNSYNSCNGVQIDGQNACQLAIDAVDRLLNSGMYSLAEDWSSIFAGDNAGNSEHIFVAAFLPETDLGMNLPHRALHYNQITPSAWNGFATLAETYYAFDEDDQRRSIFLEGQQYNLNSGERGEPVDNRQGEPLIFTPEIGDVTAASEGEGVRILKFPVDPEHTAQFQGNDYPFFRLSEMYLIKAEALNELGGPSEEALSLVNDLRARVFEADESLSLAAIGSQQGMRDAILQERLFELTYEAKRRQDLVRHGKFTDEWTFKPASDPFRVVFPIPQAQRDANSNLDQNVGYN